MTDREELLGYADSLNQQANWIEEALAPETPILQRIGIEDIDIDELRGASDLLRRLASSDGGVKVRELEADPWVDTRLVRFDDTIVFGRGGFDFDKWESLRWECHTRHGSFAVWKSGRQSWSLYGGKYGALALDRYSSESQAKADVEQLILSYDGEIATPTAPSVAMKVKPLDLGKLVRAKLPCCSIADYEARIRSALVEVQAMKGEPEPVAWLRHGPDGDAFDICDEDADGAFAVFAAAPPADAGMREALKDAEGIFEQIRLALIKHLDEPVRSAFWKAVEGREKCRAAFTAPGATTKSDGGALSSLPAGESEPVVMQASPPSDPLSTRSEVTALTAIAKERQRQREVEGTPEPVKAGDAGAMREARVSIMARTIRQTLRDYGHKTAESSLPEYIASDIEKALSTAQPDTAAQGGDFQSRVKPWMQACFGPVIPLDKTERNHRFLEEALELVQSIGCTQSEAHQLVDYVFGRPVGDPKQEVGGVMVTLAALCLANGLDMADAGETELARIWTKVEAIRAKQAAKPKHSPLPGPSDTAPAEPVAWQWLASGTWHTIDKHEVADPEQYARSRSRTVRPIYTHPPRSVDVEAIARVIQCFWQGPSGRSWEECCEKLPAQAGWFRRLARSIAAMIEGLPSDPIAQAAPVSVDEVARFIKENAYPTFDDWEHDFARALRGAFNMEWK